MPNILELLGTPVKGLVDGVGSIIDSLHTSDEEKAEAKLQLVRKVAEFETSMAAAQRDVLVAEIKGESWLQRNWRPITMMAFVVILVNNFILVPYVTAFGANIPTLEIPPNMYGLLTVGVGGYIASRGVEKVVGMRNGKTSS